MIRGVCAHCSAICPICEEPLQKDNKRFFVEDGVRRPACERCSEALVNRSLLQKLNQYKKGDLRVLLRKELGVQGKYRPLTVSAK
jgi:hypothetical protein